MNRRHLPQKSLGVAMTQNAGDKGLNIIGFMSSGCFIIDFFMKINNRRKIEI